MALFGNYNKPGPGIDKNSGYEVTRLTFYFQLLGRKFWNLCVLSVVVSLFTLPYILCCYGLYRLTASLSFVGVFGQVFHILISMIPFLFYGPVLAAGFKVARDYAREEPVFLFHDFWKTFRSNLGKPIVFSALTGFLTCCIAVALPFYMNMPGLGTYLFFPLCMLAAMVLMFMQYYIYTMAVSFELSVKQILKNGLILSFVAIGNNLLTFLVLLFVLLLLASLFILAISYSVLFGFLLVALVCVVPGFCLFSVSFITHPVLQRYIVEPYYEANPQQTSAVLQRTPLDEGENAPKELPEYVYHNGRMVHRSVLESESLFDDNQKIGPDKE